MKLEDLKLRRVYQLTREVENPFPDRRVNINSSSAWPSFSKLWAGMQFFVTDSTFVLAQNQEAVSKLPFCDRVELERYGPRFSERLGRRVWHDTFVEHRTGKKYTGPNWFDMIVEALEPAPVTLDVFFTAHGEEILNADNVLESLIRHGMLTWETLAAGIAVRQADMRTDDAREVVKVPPLPRPLYEGELP